jgi:hypothetical protein
MKLRGDRCLCRACGLYFNSTYAFDKHRAGAMTERRCLDVPALLARGWGLTVKGFWATRLRAAI